MLKGEAAWSEWKGTKWDGLLYGLAGGIVHEQDLTLIPGVLLRKL